MKLETISTGGGCEGLYLEHPLGRLVAGYFVITDLDGCHVPTKGKKAILGWYTDDSQFIESLDIIF
jgi:hypothetical protein